VGFDTNHILDMALKRHDTMADMVIAKCVPKQVAECLVPFLGLLWSIHRFMNEK